MPSWTEDEYAAYIIRNKQDAAAEKATVQKGWAAKPAAPVPAPRTGTRTQHKRGEMNGTERAYSLHLDTLKQVGEITWWAFEAVVFTLAHRVTYRPDFLVHLPGGRTEVHEVKGWLEDDAAVKLRVFSDRYPWPIYVIKKTAAGWTKKEW